VFLKISEDTPGMKSHLPWQRGWNEGEMAQVFENP